MTTLAAGDPVKVQADPDLFKIAQEDHGGWDDVMAEVRACGFYHFGKVRLFFVQCRDTVLGACIDCSAF